MDLKSPNHLLFLMKSSFHRSIFLLFFAFVSTLGYSQKYYLIDRETNQGISDASIYNQTKATTLISDDEGVVNLSAFHANDTLYISHLIYESILLTKGQWRNKNYRLFMAPKTNLLNEVVMSVSKWEQELKDIPDKVISIDASEIALHQPQTSADLLMQSGKVYVQKSQSGGGSPMIRGFSANRLLLAVDGVRMNNAIFRGGNLQNSITVDAFTLKNTEVLFGTGSVIYGSDALGGVINYFTKNPKFYNENQSEYSGMMAVRYASANSEKTTHGELQYSGKKWAVIGSISYNHFGDLIMGSNGPDDYLRPYYSQRQGSKDIIVQNPNPKVQIPTGYDQIHLFEKILFKPNENWLHSLGIYYSNTTNYPRYDRLTRPGKNGNLLRSGDWYYGPQLWNMYNYQAVHKEAVPMYDQAKLSFAFQKFGESRHSRDFNDPILSHNDEKVDDWTLTIDFDKSLNDRLDLYYGMELIDNKVHSVGKNENIDTGEINPAQSRYPDNALWKSAAAYVNSSFKPTDKISVLAGLRYSFVHAETYFNPQVYNFPFKSADVNNGALTGSAGLSYMPREDWQFSANVSTGFRAPNIDDMSKIFDSQPGAVVVPNQFLRPEYAYGFDLGIKKNFSDRLLINLTGFYTLLDHVMILQDFDRFVVSGNFAPIKYIEYQGENSRVQALQNLEQEKVFGFETELNYHIDAHWGIHSNLSLSKGYSYAFDKSKSRARHLPPTFGNFKINYNAPKVMLSADFAFNGVIYGAHMPITELEKDYMYALNAYGVPYSPSWYTINLRSSIKLSDHTTAIINLENLTDQRYRTYSSGVSAAGINFISSLQYRF